MAYDREAYRLRGENARLNFPELFLGKNKEAIGGDGDQGTSSSSSEAMQTESVKVNAEEEEKPVVSDPQAVATTASPTEFVWGDAEEAWFSTWGPGSSVWDDIDGANSLFLQSRLSPVAPDSAMDVQDQNQGTATSSATTAPPSSSSSPMFIWKDS